MSTDRKTLIDGLKAKCQQAHRDLLRKYQGMLLRRARDLGCTREDAEEAVLDTLLAATVPRNIRNLSDDDSLVRWLFTVLRRNVVAQWRRANARISSGAAVGDSNPRSDEGAPPDAELSRRENIQALEAAIERLPECFRIPLRLHLRGRSYGEIADQCAIPPGTAASRVFRAKERLAKDEILARQIRPID